MIYDTIDTKKIMFGQTKQIFGKKLLIPVFYEKSTLEFTERNRYVNINGIQINQYDKKQLIIKSQTFNDIVTDIVDYINKENNINIRSPINPHGNLHINITKETRFTDMNRKSINMESIEDSFFCACVSIVVPTYFIDGDKATIQLNVGECVVISIKKSFEIDFDKLALAD